MRKLALFAAIIVVVGGWYILKDAGHVPLFSANLERLAETASEGYCTGVGFWSGGTDPENRKAVAAKCREQRPSTPVDLTAVQPAFCRAVTNEGYEQGVDVCMEIVQSARLWPTYDGNLTRAWSRNFPYPGEQILQQTPTNDSRTGDREGNLRP